MENLLFYHIKHKTICFLFYFWNYENTYRKDIRNWDQDLNENMVEHTVRQTYQKKLWLYLAVFLSQTTKQSYRITR